MNKTVLLNKLKKFLIRNQWNIHLKELLDQTQISNQSSVVIQETSFLDSHVAFKALNRSDQDFLQIVIATCTLLVNLLDKLSK